MPTEQNTHPIFSGEFCHALDGKNRITIPSRWRKGEADEFFIMPDSKGAFVRVMPPEEFLKVSERTATAAGATPEEHAVFLRHFYSRSTHVAIDKQGRILVPDEYCQRANLRGEIILLGVRDTFEMWNREAWNANRQSEEAIYNRIAKISGL